MLSSSQFERFAEACRNVGNQVAGDDGFVTVRGLLSHFQARLIIRPLLVEGMLASVDSDNEKAGFDTTEWAVLVDSESYDVTDVDVQRETRETPLPTRFRNTVAHELVHSLAFRPSEFGVRLAGQKTAAGNVAQLVQDIEKDTERLSPLLLWPEKAIHTLVAGRSCACSVGDFVHVCFSMGISRHVLVNRLGLLHRSDAAGFLYTAGLRNLAVGLAEWTNGKTAVLRSWPLFMNFDQNVIPAFLFKASDHDRAPAEDIFGDDALGMCGGPEDSVAVVTPAGTPTSSNAHSMKVEIAFERASSRAGAEFLYVVRKA